MFQHKKGLLLATECSQILNIEKSTYALFICGTHGKREVGGHRYCQVER